MKTKTKTKYIDDFVNKWRRKKTKTFQTTKIRLQQNDILSKRLRLNQCVRLPAASCQDWVRRLVACCWGRRPAAPPRQSSWLGSCWERASPLGSEGTLCGTTPRQAHNSLGFSHLSEPMAPIPGPQGLLAQLEFYPTKTTSTDGFLYPTRTFSPAAFPLAPLATVHRPGDNNCN